MSETSQTTSLALPPPAAPAQEPKWIELQAAARLMDNMNEGALRRKCGSQWQGEGKAKLVQENGKRSQWMVRSDADPRLTPGAIVNIAPAEDLKKIPRKLLDRALERKAILDRWAIVLASAVHLNMKKDQATESFLVMLSKERAAGTLTEKATRPTLYNWKKQFDEGGIAGLIDHRAGRHIEEKADADDPFLHDVLENWLQQTKPSVQECWRASKLVAGRNGWRIISYRTTARFVQTFEKEHPDIVVLRREGPEAFKNKMAAHITRDYSQINSNDLWNADHHLFDVIVKVGEKKNPATGKVTPVFARPWLTAWQDVRSRKIVGWYISLHPNTDTILWALVMAVRSHHVPFHILSDNGKDFDCQALTGETKKMRWQRRKVRVEIDVRKTRGVYTLLKVDHMHAWPFHGQSKPIERFFGTVAGRFSKSFNTYCGRNPQERPEQLPDMLEKGMAPTLEEFITKFSTWIEVGYNQHEHTGDSMDGMTPADAWRANLHDIRTFGDYEALELYTERRYGPYKIGQNGITHKNLGYGQYDLYRWHGRSVFISYNDGLDSVKVFDADTGSFLTVAQANVRISPLATPEHLEQQLKIQKAANKQRRDAARMIPQAAGDFTDRLNAAAAEQAAQRRVTAAPATANFKLIASDAAQHMPAIRAAKKQPKLPAPREKFDIAAFDDAPTSAKQTFSIADFVSED